MPLARTVSFVCSSFVFPHGHEGEVMLLDWGGGLTRTRVEGAVLPSAFPAHAGVQRGESRGRRCCMQKDNSNASLFFGQAFSFFVSVESRK